MRVELPLERLDVLAELLQNRHGLLLLLLDAEGHFTKVRHEIAGGGLVGDVRGKLLGERLDFADGVLGLLLDLLDLLNGGLIIHGGNLDETSGGKNKDGIDDGRRHDQIDAGEGLSYHANAFPARIGATRSDRSDPRALPMTSTTPRRVGIYAAVRLPFARAYTAYKEDTNLSLLVASLRALVARTKLEGERLGDVAAGATMVDPREWNLAREALIEAGLSPETPGYDLARACGTSAEAAVAIANKIALGQIDAGIAAGVDSISGLPLLYPRRFAELATASAQARSLGARLSPWTRLRPRDLKPEPPRVKERTTGLTMGESCELMAKTWKITREEQDRLAWESHQNAARAWKEGFYDELVVAHRGLERDNNVRPDTSLEKLATLRPVFDRSPAGTLTAGNSTPLTDGAAGLLLASEEWGRARGLEPWAFLVDAQVAAVDFFGPPHEGLLMAPAYAVPRLLDRARITLNDFDYYEIHEAFAAQVLCTLKAWESEEFCRTRLGRDRPLGPIDRTRLNVKGGSIALGHPFGATGARIIGGLAKLLRDKGRGRGLVSVCTGGGMGVTLILER